MLFSRIPTALVYCIGFIVAGSASWRIPLALQFLPGISLCLGCFVLPPSPRLLVLRGRIDDARKTLARLRLRTPEEAKEDPLIQAFISFYLCLLTMTYRSSSYWKCKSTLLSSDKNLQTDSHAKHGRPSLAESTLDELLLAS